MKNDIVFYFLKERTDFHSLYKIIQSNFVFLYGLILFTIKYYGFPFSKPKFVGFLKDFQLITIYIYNLPQNL